jgi:hypothetical protein
MGQTARFQETLRRLAMIDEGFGHDVAAALEELEPMPADRR